jgi:hypothetical protein
MAPRLRPVFEAQGPVSGHGLFPFPHVLRTPLMPEQVRKLGAISTRLRFERRRLWSSVQRLFWGRVKGPSASRNCFWSLYKNIEDRTTTARRPRL